MLRTPISNWIRAAFPLMLVFAMSGCGTTTRQATFEQDFTPTAAAKITVGEISDAAPRGKRGDQEDFDTEAELRVQLESKLLERGLLSTDDAEGKPYILNARIIDYEPGSAGKRWLVPGYGATELSVECTVHEGDRVIGTVYARRTVEAGGLYTVGAWRTVFETVADEIVSELQAKLGT